MPEPLTISAKQLGEFALPDACPRCLWLKLRLGWKTPYNIFPSVFSKLDVGQKNYVESYLERHGKLPGWMSSLGDVSGSIKPPGYKNFSFTDQETGVTVRGTADLILKRSDGTKAIVDLKTAANKGEKDPLLPMYRVQQTSYMLAAANCGIDPVDTIALAYIDPSYDRETMSDPAVERPDGLAVPFHGSMHMLKPDFTEIKQLCQKAASFYNEMFPPEPADGCKDCETIDRIVQLLTSPASAFASTESRSLRNAYSQLGVRH